MLCVAATVALSGCSRPAVPRPVEPPSSADHAAPAAGTGASPAGQTTPPSTAARPNRADTPVLADFQARVKTYTALHAKLEETLPGLGKESSPEQIDRHQRALARLLQKARTDAKPGNIFTPDVQAVVRRVMADVFGGSDGAALKSSIMDENPGPIKLSVNGRYPDAVPLSTVPPQVLRGLPELPDELEFRFIGRHLILMDEHAHIIVDLMENVLPG